MKKAVHCSFFSIQRQCFSLYFYYYVNCFFSICFVFLNNMLCCYHLEIVRFFPFLASYYGRWKLIIKKFSQPIPHHTFTYILFLHFSHEFTLCHNFDQFTRNMEYLITCAYLYYLGFSLKLILASICLLFHTPILFHSSNIFLKL